MWDSLSSGRRARSTRERGAAAGLLTSAILCIALASTAGPLGAQSLEERVGAAADHTYYHGMTEEIARERVGEEGVPVLLGLLADAAFPRRDNVVAFLTYLGGPEATPALLHLLASPGPSSVPEEDRALLLVPQSLGHIAGRGDPSALEALLEMTAHGSGGGVLATTAVRAGRPSLRDDLLAMALRGLAFARHPQATRRLLAIESGSARPVANSRALRDPATGALALLDWLEGGPARSSDDANQPAAPGGQHADQGAGPGAALDGGADAPAEPSTPRVFDPVHSVVRLARLTYANHRAVTNPMTNDRLDAVLGKASLHLGRADWSVDVACCSGMARLGNAATFGADGDGLDIIDNEAEQYAVMNHTAGRVKIVRVINYCSRPATNVLGCAWVAGNGMALVRFGDAATEGALWAHEYGHNAGLQHNADSRYIMYGCLCGGNLGLTQVECGKYYAPASGTQMVMVDVGACTDRDADQVQDLIDNCPAVSNNDQSDGDGDGVGDVCDGAAPPPTPLLDVDGGGQALPLTDGLMVVRWLFGLTGQSLTHDAVGSGCTRCTALDILRHLDANRGSLDIDGDGESEPLTDGLLVQRWLFGLRGGALVDGAVDNDCTRCSSQAIENHLTSLSQ